MKKWMLRASVLLLAMLLAMGAVGCQSPADEPDTDKEQTPDVQQSDGIPSIEDHDPSKTYELPDYGELNIADYITLGKYRGLTLTLDYDTVTVTDAELQAEITAILKEHHPGAKITDRAVAWGDTVIADYVGTLDGVAFNGGTATEQMLMLKDNSGYIPGFVEGLVGAMPGEEWPVDVTSPENYHAAELAGKAVVFTFTVHYIEGNPTLDDAFVTDYTEGEYTSAEEYRTALRQQMAEEAYEAELHSVLWATIAENAAAKQYPVDAVMYYYDYQYDMYNYYAAMYGLDYKTFCAYNGFLPENLFNSCMQLVKEDMVYYAVFEAGSYTYTDEQYERALEQYTAQNYASLRDMMMSGGAEDFSYEEAKAYFDRTYENQLISQCLEESAFNDLIKDMNVVIGEPEESAS